MHRVSGADIFSAPLGREIHIFPDPFFEELAPRLLVFYEVLESEPAVLVDHFSIRLELLKHLLDFRFLEPGIYHDLLHFDLIDPRDIRLRISDRVHEEIPFEFFQSGNVLVVPEGRFEHSSVCHLCFRYGNKPYA